MSTEYRNIYQIARESAGITQEHAAELIDISVESLRAYEYAKRIPPDKVVIKMIEIYNAQYLAYQHLKTSEEIGKRYLPDLEIKDLPTAILRVLKETEDFIECRKDLIDITCDGLISDNELPRWKYILEQLDELANAIMALKFAKVTNPNI